MILRINSRTLLPTVTARHLTEFVACYIKEAQEISSIQVEAKDKLKYKLPMAQEMDMRMRVSQDSNTQNTISENKQEH